MSREKWLNSMTEWMDTLDQHLQEFLQIFHAKMKGKLMPIQIFETDSELLLSCHMSHKEKDLVAFINRTL